jgi:beta-phosphoglucomutase
MLKAIIFDFNGIILNDEPIHFRAMRDTVAGLGIQLSEEEYWAKYLPFDDERCLDEICRNHSVTLTADQRRAALTRKVDTYQNLMSDGFPVFPGAADFVRLAAARYPLAIASGARREEVESTLHATDLIGCFRVIVAAQDFTLGKPHPESFLLALQRLNGVLDGHGSPIRADECLVIEDSVGGVRGATAAGMKCLAISNTYPHEQLAGAAANLVAPSLQGLDLDSLKVLFEDTP